MAFRWYRNIFAQAGDVNPVPDSTVGSGFVSYEEGYGGDYDLPIGTDPQAKAIERDSNNQILRDATGNIKVWQQNTYPEFAPASVNGGVAVEYPRGARVTHNNTIYEVINATGTTTEPPHADWWDVEKGLQKTITTLTTSQTWDAPDNLASFIKITAYGGGGGGRNGRTSTQVNVISGRGGASAAEVITMSSLAITDSLDVVIGEGGDGRTTLNNDSDTHGTDTTVTLDATVIAKSTGAPGQTTAPISGEVGDIVNPGGNPDREIVLGVPSSSSGTSQSIAFGTTGAGIGGGFGGNAGTVGGNAVGINGAGGGGGAATIDSSNTTTFSSGGNGAPGSVILEYDVYPQ